MTSLARQLADEYNLAMISVPRLKPLGSEIARFVAGFKNLIVLEEHSRYGGLCSAMSDALCESGGPIPRIKSLSLEDKFVEKCGSWQYALSEHNLADDQVRRRIRDLLA
jgi:transketolase